MPAPPLDLGVTPPIGGIGMWGALRRTKMPVHGVATPRAFAPRIRRRTVHGRRWSSDSHPRVLRAQSTRREDLLLHVAGISTRGYPL
jgi:hypothetical protein